MNSKLRQTNIKYIFSTKMRPGLRQHEFSDKVFQEKETRNDEKYY